MVSVATAAAHLRLLETVAGHGAEEAGRRAIEDTAHMYLKRDWKDFK